MAGFKKAGLGDHPEHKNWTYYSFTQKSLSFKGALKKIGINSKALYIQIIENTFGHVILFFVYNNIRVTDMTSQTIFWKNT